MAGSMEVAPEPVPSAKARSSRRRRLLRLLEVSLALALLAFVASRLPWRDTLTLEGTEEGLEAVPGRILGDWKSDSARFVFDEGVVPEPDWPEAWREAAREGRPLELGAAEGAAGGPAWQPRPGLPRVFRSVQPAGLLQALGLLVVGVLFGVTRWWRLLHIAGCGTRWRDAARLTFLGLFFNLVLPGLTGGDLVKAGLAVRDHPHARADALVSVFIDRILGLWALLGLAAAVLLVVENPAFERLVLPVVLSFLVATAVIAVVLHPGSRRVVRLERWIDKLPQARRLAKMDHAARIYGGHPLEVAAAFALSIGNHLCTAGALLALGTAFGATLGFTAYVAVGSVANTITAVPIAPGGWGLGEAAYGTLFELVGSAATLGVAVSVTYRLLIHAIGLGGGLALLLPGGASARRAARRAEAVLEDAELGGAVLDETV